MVSIYRVNSATVFARACTGASLTLSSMYQSGHWTEPHLHTVFVVTPTASLAHTGPPAAKHAAKIIQSDLEISPSWPFTACRKVLKIVLLKRQGPTYSSVLHFAEEAKIHLIIVHWCITRRNI